MDQAEVSQAQAVQKIQAINQFKDHQHSEKNLYTTEIEIVLMNLMIRII